MRQPVQDAGEPDSHHDDGDDRLADQLPQHDAFDGDPQQQRGNQRQQKRRPEGGAELDEKGQADKRPQRHERTGGQIQHARGLENQHIAQGD